MTTPKIACPYCLELESKVTDSRPSAVGDAIWRRRQCLHCGQRFSTEETLRGRYQKNPPPSSTHHNM